MEVTKALETLRDATLAEKIDLEKAMEEYVTKAETQICAHLNRIKHLETELEVLLETFKAFKEEKNSEILQIQKNISDLTNQKQEVGQLGTVSSASQSSESVSNAPRAP